MIAHFSRRSWGGTRDKPERLRERLLSGQIAEALHEVDGGQSFVVESDDPEVRARRIQQLSSQSPEERGNSTKLLRDNYNNTYPWSKECERFKRMIQDLLSGMFMTPFSGFEKIVLPWEVLLCFISVLLAVNLPALVK